MNNVKKHSRRLKRRLMPPVPRRPLILYLTVLDESVGSVLGQHDENGRKEGVIYYLSKNSQIMSLDMPRHTLAKDWQNGKLSFSECDIVYMTKKSIKGSTITDHLADNPIDDYQPMKFEFLDEDILVVNKEEENEKSNRWKMYFDGAVNIHGSRFFLSGEVLYKRSYNGALLRCVDVNEANQIFIAVHDGIYGTHANGHMMAWKILRAGYYWMIVEKDCISYVWKCHKCQIYADRINVPPFPLYYMATPWPFSMWGIDVIGPINPKASNGHCFILVGIDYFTKWVESASYATVTQHAVAKFLKFNIICQYGQPERIITDNGPK
ncbi:hypothetical protein L6164_005674 [Bauhinia variegata]|uniref:Uncharacterized protein n=1 Tax=Bauhinia variegata TaxID=167791 RepID=A0ACB9PRJ5_BAUVA|nr:hypothetical protein L6164_005674 [Bauhinia variegata]